MKNIDFLPPRYRERHRQRQAFAWEIAVVAFFGLLIAAGALWQLNQRWRVGNRLAALKESFQQAVELQALQEQLQAKLSTSSEAAELYLYLEHPWPRTQVLRAMESCLPEGMYLTDIHIAYEATTGPPALSEEELRKLSPARRDMARLRRESDRRVGVVKIAGTTGDASLIYQFAHRLGQLPPLATVKLETAENQPGDALQQTGFRLRGVLKPGYFQAGGPEATLAEQRP
jgi:hypothetical protein